MAEEVYRLIPSVRSMVDNELMIHKHTKHSTEYWLNEFVRKGHVVRLICAQNKDPRVAITTAWQYSPYERKSYDPPSTYLMLKDTGEWKEYTPGIQKSWRDRHLH